MKSKTVVIIGILLSLVGIFIQANIIEKGDTNAVSMYFVVFFIPMLILAVLNGLYIRTIARLTNRTMKSILCFLPIAALWLLSLMNSLTIYGVDRNMTFAAKVGAIAFGLTNGFWIISSFKSPELES